MLELRTDKMNRDYAETNDISISIGKIEENTQVATIATGWTEEEKNA